MVNWDTKNLLLTKNYDITNQVSYAKEENRQLSDVGHVPCDNQNYINVPQTPALILVACPYLHITPKVFFVILALHPCH